MPRRNRGPHLVLVKGREDYYISWTDNGRSRRRSTGTGDIGAAQVELQDFLTRRPGRTGPRDPGQFPILTALEDYGREHAPTTAAPERLAYAIDALLPFWSGRTVADITRETCRAYGRERARAPGTIRRELGMLRASINHEVREGRLTRPVTVWLPPKPDGKDRWLTRSEAAALLRAARRDKRCRLYLPLFILIGLGTGARKEAILSLRWCQIDLDRARIDFNPPGRTRTSKGRPIIPIPRGLLWFLRKARERGTELGYVINRDGRRVLKVSRSFPTAAIRAGLCEPVIDAGGNPVMVGKGEKKKPKMKATVSPHTLRHTAGTWMAQRAVPLWEIAGFLGQTHERTAALYSHHSPDFLARAREALD